MRYRMSAVAGLLLAVAVAAPASANTVERFSAVDVIEDTYSCGVVLTTDVDADLTVHFASDGTWLGTEIRISYSGRAVDPSTGQVIELASRQILSERADRITVRGQGIFIRLAGRGVVLHDVGRLVFDPADGSTIAASAKVIPFDDPEAIARIDAAVCSLFD